MNDRNDNDSTETSPDRAPGALAAQPGPAAFARRRKVLRGAAAAVPSILTLHSGAALARSSNLLSIADGAPLDAKGRALCLDESSVEPAQAGGKVYDLGEPPHATVTGIPGDKSYYREANADTPKVGPQEMCQSGGDFYVQENGDELASLGKQADGGSMVQPEVRVSTVFKEVQPSWKKVNVPRGGLVSATALASFVGGIHVRDI